MLTNIKDLIQSKRQNIRTFKEGERVRKYRGTSKWVYDAFTKETRRTTLRSRIADRVADI